MRKSDGPAFGEFLADEAKKYVRDITSGEIETWFETFKKTTIEDFKLAWVQHKRDERNGRFFPNIPTLQRLLRITGENNAARDWRCAEEIGGTRCNYPGSISTSLGGGVFHCRAHYRLKGSTTYTTDASLQIIESSQSYTPPKTLDELFEQSARVKAAYYGENDRLKQKATPAPRMSEEEVLAELHAKGYPVPSPHLADDSHLFEEEGVAP